MPNLKKILVVGGGGFVGRNLLETLSDKYNFTVPSRQDLDLLDSETVKRFLQGKRFDLLIYAANKGGNRAQTGIAGVFENNKKMFLNLAEHPESFSRMIFLGSGAEYGKQREVKLVKESDFGQIYPQDEYGMAKYFVSEYIAEHENMLNLRCFGAYGKYEDYKTRFISNAICRALLGLPIVIRQNVRFDYMYIQDLIKIIDYFINNAPREKFYNTGTGQPVELTELGEIVKQATGGNAEIRIKNPGYNKEYTCDNSRLVSETKISQFTPHQEAIKEMVKYYKTILPSIKREDLGFDE